MYKVVYVNESGGKKKLTSLCMVPMEVNYKKGRWIKANAGCPEPLFVFSSRAAARELKGLFSENSCLEIWKVEVKGPTGPPHQDDYWPEGTVFFKQVKLVARA